jgi:surface antigen
MTRHRLAVGTTAAMIITAVVAISGSPALGASHVTARSQRQASCASTSTTGAKASKYDTTPKGRGPWHVPLDPCNTEGYGAASTPYYNCAYWAAEKRPDIWVNAVWKYGYSVAPGGAWNIELDAKKAHYVINHHPKVGDVAAWPDDATMGHTSSGMTYYASPGGHVAYVQKVHKSSITISTMGVNNSGGLTESFVFNKHKTFFIHAGRTSS